MSLGELETVKECAQRLGLLEHAVRILLRQGLTRAGFWLPFDGAGFSRSQRR